MRSRPRIWRSTPGRGRRVPLKLTPEYEWWEYLATRATAPSATSSAYRAPSAPTGPPIRTSRARPGAALGRLEDLVYKLCPSFKRPSPKRGEASRQPDARSVIIGAGPVGLACAIEARREGLSALVVDKGALVNSIVGYPAGMEFFSTPT